MLPDYWDVADGGMEDRGLYTDKMDGQIHVDERWMDR